MKLVAATDPKVTLVALVSCVPEMTTEVPPVLSPEFVLRPVIVGAGVVKVNWSAEVVFETPLPDWTVTSTVPSDDAGAMAVIEVGLFT